MIVQKVLESLNNYTGDSDTLNDFVTVAETEFGSDWTEKIYAAMGDIPPSLKEKLDHAFNYYAATTAWNEIQSYLTQETPLNYQQTLERVPVLEHWLAFFGASGEEAVAQLQTRLKQEGQAESQDTGVLDTPFAPIQTYEEKKSDQPMAPIEQETMPQSETVDVPSVEMSDDKYRPSFVDEEPQGIPLSEEELEDRISDIFSGTEEQGEAAVPSVLETEKPILQVVSEVSSPVVEAIVEPIQTSVVQTLETSVMAEQMPQKPTETVPLQTESEPSWRVNKIFKQIDFVVAIQAWISGRCHDLGYTDYYTYRYYGFLVDVIDTTIIELKNILADVALYELIENRQVKGVHFLQNQLLAFEKESKEAHEGVLADLSPLPREGLSVEDLKKNLGGMDTSATKEYLGPAPDGFEVVEDPYANLSDEKIQQEYAKIEETGDLSDIPAEPMIQPTVKPVIQTMVQSSAPKNQEEPAKNTSQTPQNGVQRKMTFNFGVKKPAGSGSTGS